MLFAHRQPKELYSCGELIHLPLCMGVRGLQSGTLVFTPGFVKTIHWGVGKRMLYLHIYLKLRKNVGFTNIF